MARKPKVPAAPTLPSIPPQLVSLHKLAKEQALVDRLQEMVVHLEQRCLDNAVLLAQQAARRRGPLVAHFMELGQRYQETLNAPERPNLRVVKGGAS